MAQRLKYLPAMREIWVQSLGWEDALEKEMATHSSILAWKIPWTEEPGLQSMGLQSRTRLSDFMSHEMMPWTYTDEIFEPQRQRENLVNFQLEGIPSKGEQTAFSKPQF